METDEKIIDEFKNNDKCVKCGAITPYPPEVDVDRRMCYIDGAGQLCVECFTEIYGTP